MLALARKEVILVATKMLTKDEHRASQTLPSTAAPTEEDDFGPTAYGDLIQRKERGTYLTWRDLAGTAVAALVVLVYVANGQDWWYLGSNRWAAVTMVAIGAVGCTLGARLVGEKLSSTPIVLLWLLGVAALVFAVLAIVTAAQWVLLMLALVVVALWAGTTLRHAVTPPPRLAVQ
jgi:hypothetical protein